MTKAIDLLVHDVHAPGKDVYNNAFDTLEEMKDYLDTAFEGAEEYPIEYQFAYDDAKERNTFPVILSEISGASSNVHVLFVDEYTTDDEVNDFIHGN